jgi:NAD(P)-dependent dehydrogenase (short-subunit alcohol dehydrogenase family)
MGRSLEGKVVWITGAGSGIGRAVAEEAARAGATLALSGRRRQKLEAAAAELEGLGAKAGAFPCDVTEEEQVAATVEAVVERFGGLDVAIANAGFSVAGRVSKLSADEWRRQLDVNVVGAAMTAKYALKSLRERRGRLALVGSVAGYICAPKMAAYSASKHAVRALGQTLSIELHGSGVSCTTVHPGYVESEIAQVDNEGVWDPERQDKRPAKLMWPADKAARVVWRAILKRRREIVFTGHGKVGAFIGQHLPAMAHLLMRR